MLSLLFPILGLCASLISAEDSIPYKFKADDSSFLYATKIDDCTYKISSTGYSGVAGNSFHITDVQNINNATIVASEIGPTALLDVYKVREGGSPTAQVFVRTNMTQEEIRGTQQISVADAHLSYYSWPYQYVFYFCKTPILTDDFYETEDTLFMRRTEVCLPEGCWDTGLDITRQGLGGNS